MSSSLDHLLLLLLILMPLSMHACTAARPLPMLAPPKSQLMTLVGLELNEATSDNVPSSSHDLDLANPNQVLKRVMLGKASEAEDVDVMDYAQPHKKPPIQNEKKHWMICKTGRIYRVGLHY